MSFGIIILFVLAGFFSGIVNAIAGGGTFITFGAMTLAGISPITANATSAISQMPGYITSTIAYIPELRRIKKLALILTLVSIVGATIGASILIMLEEASFRKIVPWLLIAATALFAAGPWLQPKQRAENDPTKPSHGLSAVAQFITSIYGGFFSAGMGIMMLATLGLTEKTSDYHLLNALKNLLSNVIAALAVIIFIAGGVIDWMAAIIMLPAVGVGGYCGVWAAKKLPQSLVRAFVIATGIGLALYYFIVD